MNPIKTVRREPSNPALAPYVKYMWSMTAPAGTHMDHWLVPVCNCDLVVNLSSPAHCTGMNGAESVLVGAKICGIRTQSTHIEQKGPIHVIGAAFYPEGLFPFIRISMVDTVDQTLPAEQFMEGFRFSLNMDTKASETEQLLFLENSLSAVLDQIPIKKRQIPKEVSAFCRCEGMFRIRDFCDENGIHPRTMERYFVKYVGITPREYRKLFRIQGVVRGIIDNPAITFTEQAVEHGYYDQPHFTREFNVWLNQKPSEFKEWGSPVLEEIRRNQKKPGLSHTYKP